MAEKRKPTGFIRVRGRIVPIFGKKGSKRREGIEGSAALSGGLGLSVGGAVLAGKLRNKASRLKDIADITAENSMAAASMRKGGRIPKSAFAAQRKAHMNFNKAKKSAKAGVFSFKKSRLISASLVGIGVDKLIKASGVEDNSFVSEFTSEATGVGAAFVTESFSNRSLQKVAHGKSIRSGLKKDAIGGLKKLGSFLLRKKGFKF